MRSVVAWRHAPRRRGFGQMKNINASNEEKEEAKKLVEDVKTGN
jgi:hypothetical protein